MTERNADVSKTLTEQWKKGKLPSGFYYVKNEFGNIFPADYSEDYDCIGDRVIKDFFTEVSEIKEVLEPVPSYEEWQRALHYAGKYEFEYTSCAMDYENLKEENTKLKELLKGAREVLKMVDTYSGDYDSINGFLIVEEISQVLGEE